MKSYRENQCRKISKEKLAEAETQADMEEIRVKTTGAPVGDTLAGRAHCREYTRRRPCRANCRRQDLRDMDDTAIGEHVEAAAERRARAKSWWGLVATFVCLIRISTGVSPRYGFTPVISS